MNDNYYTKIILILGIVLITFSVIILIGIGYVFLLNGDLKKNAWLLEETRLSIKDYSVKDKDLIIDEDDFVFPDIEKKDDINTVNDLTLESFDYRRLVFNAKQIIEKSSEQKLIVVKEEEAFKACVESGINNYLICKYSNGYCVVTSNKNVLEKNCIFNNFYGVQIVSHSNLNVVVNNIAALRERNYPAFALKWITDSGVLYYGVNIGIFPDKDSANEYSQSLDESEITEITGWNIGGRYIRALF
ncbi:MAG: hypothetical protein PWQ77_1562 [Kosmotogales bacterium]|nr:hypothetical protein [Kosmotogales bacterium]